MTKSNKQYVHAPPWGLDADNPFSTPWAHSTKQSGMRRNPSDIETFVSVLSQGGISFVFSPSCSKTELKPYQDFYTFLKNMMNAVCEVRTRWDYESSQQVVPLYSAALEIAETVARLKSSNKGEALLRLWWAGLNDSEKKALVRLEKILKFDWQSDEIKSFERANDRGKYARYFRYRQLDLGPVYIDCIDDKKRPLVQFGLWLSSEAVTLGQKVMLKRAARQVTASSTVGRHAYWHVILETANAFAHLSGVAGGRSYNPALPRSFPELVKHLGFIRQPLAKLAKTIASLDKSSENRLGHVVSTIDHALSCFVEPENRNVVFLGLSGKRRKETFEKRSKKYRKPSKARVPKSRQESFLGLMSIEP